MPPLTPEASKRLHEPAGHAARRGRQGGSRGTAAHDREASLVPGGPEEAAQSFVTAPMHLGGAGDGAVVMQCPLETACEFAAVMLGTEKPELANEDVKDVMGEIINMVAGNFKALLGGAHLSPPTVVEGSDYRFRILRGPETARVGFRTPAGKAYVSLVEIEEPKPRGIEKSKKLTVDGLTIDD